MSEAVNQNRVLVLIDFDGTITNKDSFFEFLFFSKSILQFIVSAVKALPSLLAYKIGLISADRAKEKIFSTFYSSAYETSILEIGKMFCEIKLPKILRDDALNSLKNHMTLNHEICVVTASAKYWVQAWCNANGYQLICTEYETKAGKITGKYLNKNCRGEIKVEKILEKYDLKNYTDIFCYGDTPDDYPMLKLGTKKFYKHFIE